MRHLGHSVTGRFRGIFIFIAATAVISAFLGATATAQTLRVAISKAPASLDPHRNLDPAAWTFIWPCYHRLVNLDEGGRPVPGLALTWRISDNGLLYTFVLSQGLTFSDGQPVDAAAVKKSFERVQKTGAAAQIYFPTLAGIEVLGPSTIRFTLNRPTPDFPQSLAVGAASVVSPGTDGLASDFLDRHSLGSGIYRIESFDPGQGAVLTARRDINITPRIDRVEAVFEPDSNRQWEMLSRHQVESADGIQPTVLDIFQEQTGLIRYEADTYAMDFIGFNPKRQDEPALQIRQAMTRSIDYKHLAQEVYLGLARPWGIPIPSGLPGANPDLSGPVYSPDEALTSISKIQTPTRPLDMIFDGQNGLHSRLAEHLKNAWTSLGLTLRLRPVSERQLEQCLNSGDYDLWLGRFRPQIASIEHVLGYWLGRSRVTGPRPQPWSPEMENLLARMMETSEAAKKKDLAYRIQKGLMEDSPYIFLFQRRVQVGLSTRVRKFSLNAMTTEAYPFNQMDLSPAVSEPEDEEEIYSTEPDPGPRPETAR